MNTWSAILFVLLGGCAGALQARVLGNVEVKIGILGNMLVNFIFGLIITLVIVSVYSWIQFHNPIKLYQQLQLEKVKFWELSSGLFGIIIVASIGFGASKIGVTGTLLLFFFSQILLGMLIDHFGIGGQQFSITPLKFFSITIIGCGMYLFFRN